MSDGSHGGSSVAVSGIGVIAPGAIGVEEFERFLREGRVGIAPVDRFDTASQSAKQAALVRDFKPKDFIPVMKMRRMNNLSRLGVAAAKLAIADARFEPGLTEPSLRGIAMATAFGPVQTSVEYIDEYIAKGAALAPPQLFPESVANAPGSHIAIEQKFEGFNLTFTQRESSALAALSYAASRIASGESQVALAGGVEEVNDIIFGVLDRLHALAPGDEVARPFDSRRSGLTMGEGSAVLFLDRAEHAAAPYAFITGYAIGRDISATLSDWGTGSDAVAATMRRALEDAEISPREVSAVWASANGSIRGDLVEARAIASLFGDAVPPVVAIKGAIGEYSGGGAVHLAAAAIAMKQQFLPASPGFRETSAEMTIPVTKTCGERDLQHMLVNSVSAGGGIVSVVFSRSAI
jgi:3-oxoacyl-[acyl-carrier-protein] synthase II